MPNIHLTLLFTGICAVMQCVLTALVIARRVQSGIHLMDGGDAVLVRRIRAHANFAETVPMALLLMLLLELGGLAASWLWWFGAALITGRVLHVGGLLIKGMVWSRLSGMVLTLAVISFEAVLCIAMFLRQACTANS
jgi:uncharacterized protein